MCETRAIYLFYLRGSSKTLIPVTFLINWADAWRYKRGCELYSGLMSFFWFPENSWGNPWVYNTYIWGIVEVLKWHNVVRAALSLTPHVFIHPRIYPFPLIFKGSSFICSHTKSSRLIFVDTREVFSQLNSWRFPNLNAFIRNTAWDPQAPLIKWKVQL